MKPRAIFLLLAFCLMFTAANAQTTAEAENTANKNTSDKVTIKTKFTAKDYEDMLKQLKDGDMNINFAALRMAYTETKDYSPYGGSSARNEISKLYGEGKYKEAIKAAENLLKTNYVDLLAQFVAWRANASLGNEEKAVHHGKVFNGLIDAIFENDGLSEETAILSIGISEQYFIMNYEGYQQQMKSLVRSEESIFDVHNAINKEEKTRKFYFNIDKVFGRLF